MSNNCDQNISASPPPGCGEVRFKYLSFEPDYGKIYNVITVDENPYDRRIKSLILFRKKRYFGIKIYTENALRMGDKIWFEEVGEGMNIYKK